MQAAVKIRLNWLLYFLSLTANKCHQVEVLCSSTSLFQQRVANLEELRCVEPISLILSDIPRIKMEVPTIQLLLLIGSWFTVVSPFKVVTGQQSESATLPCNTTGIDKVTSPYAIEWSRHGQKIPVMMRIGKYPSHVSSALEAWESFYRHHILDSIGISGRISISNESAYDASLIIRNLSVSDAGMYKCKVILIGDQYQENKPTSVIHLVVQAPPTLVVTPPASEYGKEGSALLLRCLANGVPEPVITWTKDDWSIRDGHEGFRLNNGELRVSSLRRSHSGRYTCRAQSVQGQVQHSTIVYVSAPPIFVVSPDDFTTKESGTALFSCRAKGYPANISYRWLHKNVEVSSSKAIKRRYNILDDQTLYIYDVILSDKGSVTCEASNGYGPPIRATATLTVEFRARVKQMLPVAYAGISLPLKLYCPAIAEPPLNSISWEKDGNNLRVQQNPRFSTDGNGSLIIHSVDHRDAGEYTCTPYNIVGTVGRSPPTRVLIRDPPVFTTSPNSIYERIIGTTLTIPCAGNGDPFPAISWRKLSPGFAPKFCVDGGNLSIASLRKSHHGVWQCVLSNPVADVTSDVMVFVKNTTPHAVNNFTAHALGDSSVQVRWTPGYNGGFPQDFTLWYKRVDQGDHTWMTVSIKNGDGTVVRNLISATLYQFSVIPENQKGKGPFSDTITAKTRETTTLVPPRPVYVPPPSQLRSQISEDEKIVLTWRKAVEYDQLLGYLIEYRRLAEQISSTVSSESNEMRSRRSVFNMKWYTLATTPRNVTSYTIGADKIYRDELYEFHVISVTSSQYSEPSKSLNVSTKGLLIYPPHSPLESTIENNPVFLGAIVGSLIVLIILLLFIAWCYKRKDTGSVKKTKDNTSLQTIASPRNVEKSSDTVQRQDFTRDVIINNGFNPTSSCIALHDDTNRNVMSYRSNKFPTDDEHVLESCSLLHPKATLIDAGEKSIFVSPVPRRKTDVEVLLYAEDITRENINEKFKNATLPNRLYSDVNGHVQPISATAYTTKRNRSKTNYFVRHLSFEDRRRLQTPESNCDLVFGVVGKMENDELSDFPPNASFTLADEQIQIDDDIIAEQVRSSGVEELEYCNNPLMSSSPKRTHQNLRSNAMSFNNTELFLHQRKPKSRASYSFDSSRSYLLRHNLSMEGRPMEFEIDCSNSDIEVRYMKDLRREVGRSRLEKPLTVGPSDMERMKNERDCLTQRRSNQATRDIKLDMSSSLEALLSPTNRPRQRRLCFTPDILAQEDKASDHIAPKDNASNQNNTLMPLTKKHGMKELETPNQDNFTKVSSNYLIPKPTVISLSDVHQSLRLHEGGIASPTSSSCSPRKLVDESSASSIKRAESFSLNHETHFLCHSDEFLTPISQPPSFEILPVIENSMEFISNKKTTSRYQWGSLGRLSKLKKLTLPANISQVPSCEVKPQPLHTCVTPLPVLSPESKDFLVKNSLKAQAGINDVIFTESRTLSPSIPHYQGESSSSGYITQDTIISSPCMQRGRAKRDNSSVEDNYEWDSEYAMESEILEALKNLESLKSPTNVSDELRRQLCKFTDGLSPDSSLCSNKTIKERHLSDVMEEQLKKEDIERRCAILKQEFIEFRHSQQQNNQLLPDQLNIADTQNV